LTLLGGLGSLIAALYLLDRSKRKKIVSTLRFWTPSERPQESQRRRRVREPWSLVLQLVSLMMLLLAIAQLQWGSRERRGRYCVLLLDTSAWAAQRLGGVSLLDREKQAAQRYLSTLPAQDRVMLVDADALAAPLTPFTDDRAQISGAMGRAAAGSSALNIQQALAFAAEAQEGSGGDRGEVVYIGPRMVSETANAQAKTANLRVITVDREPRHVGIRTASVTPNPNAEGAWQAAVAVKNYGPRPAVIRLNTEFAGTAFAPRAATLEGGAETAIQYNFVTNASGQFVARLEPGDDGMADNRVSLEMPKRDKLRVTVFTDRPDAFRPLFGASSGLTVRFYAASAAQAVPSADLVVLDRTSRAARRDQASIWIDPPREGSPLPVKTVARNATVKNWNSETPLGESLHARDTPIPVAEIFQTFDGDVTVGSVAEGPVVVARSRSEGRGKMAVIGFDPLSGDARLELTTPLLFANLLRWISPDVFRSVDFVAERVGVVDIPLDDRERADRIQVRDQRGFSIPFVVTKQGIELFSSAPSVLRVSSEDRETVLSMTVPDVAAFEWKAPAGSADGIPARFRLSPGVLDLWRWLALLGAFGLIAEWVLFGRRRILRPPARNARRTREALEPRENELVSR